MSVEGGVRIKYHVSSQHKFLIVFINILFAGVGVWLTPLIVVGFFGFFDSPTTSSIVIASLVIAIFLVFLAISNYFVIRKVPGKGKKYLILTGIVAFLLGFALLFYIYFSIIPGIF